MFWYAFPLFVIALVFFIIGLLGFLKKINLMDRAHQSILYSRDDLQYTKPAILILLLSLFEVLIGLYILKEFKTWIIVIAAIVGVVIVIYSIYLAVQIKNGEKRYFN